MAIKLTGGKKYPRATEEQKKVLFGQLQASMRGEQYNPNAEQERLAAQLFEDRERQYQQGVSEFNLGQREAELENRKAEAEDAATFGSRMQSSLQQFQENPMQFLMGGGQNIGELINYLNQANQLFKATGQEGNFMDSLLGNTSSPAPGSYAPVSNYASRGLAAPKPTQVLGSSSPQQSTPGFAGSNAISRSREIAQFNRDLMEQKGTDDYRYRNLTQAERKDPDFNSIARTKARQANDKEIERDMAALEARYY